MKKCSSLVWRFFDRIENSSKRCYAVLCKLCDTQYKFFGNTTNLRAHLNNKHPIQWELAQNGTLDDSNFHVDAEESNQSAATPKRKSYSTRSYKDKNIDVLENSDVEHGQNDEDAEATYNLVRHLHDATGLRNSDEEWLEDTETSPYGTPIIQAYEPRKKKMTYRKIKREVQTPPRRTSFKPVKYEKPSIVLDNIWKDEYSVFGEYVANKLRKFKTPRTRGNLQQLITTILWQAEYGLYDSAESVKRLLVFSIQEPEQSTVTQEFQTHVQSEEIIENREEEPNQSIEIVTDQ